MTDSRPFEKSRLEEYLKLYYRKGVFPFKPYTNWLTYSKRPSEYFNLREFAFILEKNGEEIHLRYRSFADAYEFEKALCDVSPHKLDLGAVYNYPPKDGRKQTDFRAMERELIFDIDLNDYDAVRKCCEGATVCDKCWKFIVMAVKILDARLKNDFGFTALLYVFSGRRGVHCWVGDEKARKLTNSARAAFAEYLSLFEGAKMDLQPKGKGRAKTSVHPMITDCYNVIMNAEKGELVKEMVVEQRWLENEEEALKDCKSAQLREELQRIFTLSKPESRWQMLRLKCDKETWKAEKERMNDLPEPPSEESRFFLLHWVLARLYPRLDVNVSTGVNHLLKSPFCIHPKTGNVAVPIDVHKVHLFDVSSCPRVDELLDELESGNRGDGEESKENKENRKMLAYKHTSLAPFVETFEKFVEKTKKTA